MSKRNLHEALKALAVKSEDYDDFRKKALDITPDILKPSVGPHLLEMFIEFKYPERER